jgi:transposase
MSNYYHLPVVGIDVAANFSIVTALKPDGDIYQKNLRIEHSLDGFSKLLIFLQKIEEEFNDSPKVFCESTGIYHLTLLHFLVNNQIDISVINPLITNSNKNSNIRKVKNDKLDSLSIAKICKFDNVKTSAFTTEEFLHLKFLVREYYKVVDLKANLKKAFSNNIYIHYPGLQNAFADITGKTPLMFIRMHPTPNHLLNAEPKAVIELLTKSSRRGSDWANNKYNKLMKIAHSAKTIGINPILFESKVMRFSESFDFYTNQLQSIIDEIHQYLDNASFGEAFKQNINLLKSFKGLGDITAITLLVEMGDINNFSKPQQLVAFFGIDPSVNQSGNFSGDRNKMSKRGTAIGRRALYTIALASIRTTKNKEPINPVLHEYYHIALDKKKKKIKLVAVMNKLLRYIFSILKNQKPYEVRNPRIHKRMFLESKLHNQVAA